MLATVNIEQIDESITSFTYCHLRFLGHRYCASCVLIGI